MNRRDFLGKTVLTGASVIAGLTVVNNIKGAHVFAAPLTPGGDVREIPLVLQDTPELQTVGGIYHLTIDELEKDILVVRMTEDTFDAVDIKCTHKGCEVAFDQKSGKKFVCPCHGSEYSLKGEVLTGPSKRALNWYETTFKDGTVTVRVPMSPEPAAMPVDSTKMKMDSTMTKKDSTGKK